MNKKIWPNCGGNGFTKHYWESVEQVVQCKACGSEGELPADKFFLQTYEDKDWRNKWSQSVYHGPCLDHTLFRKLRIHL